MQSSEVIETLNDLLKTTKDGEEGFRTCAEQAKSVNLKSMFQQAASRCDAGAIELQSTIRRLGGEPGDSGSVSGAMHRAWTAMKSSVGAMDDHEVLAECERGEDFAKSAYESALKKDLPDEIRMIVEKQYEGLKENHDKIRGLRDARVNGEAPSTHFS